MVIVVIIAFKTVTTKDRHTAFMFTSIRLGPIYMHKCTGKDVEVAVLPSNSLSPLLGFCENLSFHISQGPGVEASLPGRGATENQ